MRTSQFTLFQVFVLFILILALFALLVPMVRVLNGDGRRVQTFSNLKYICVMMQDYAASDIKFGRLPYPVAKGSKNPLPKWGETRDCWSPEIVKFLIKKKYISKGVESIYKITQKRGGNFTPMLIFEDNEESGGQEKGMELDFHIYCDSELTKESSGDTILGITYDQPDINSCLYNGEGWVLFRLDGSGGFKKRRLLSEYDFDNRTKNLLYKIAENIGAKRIQHIDQKASLRKVFGVDGNGGSTELIGRRSSSAVYKIFLREP